MEGKSGINFEHTSEINVEGNNTESRFKNKEEIIEIMTMGEPEFLGNIDDLYPDDIADHQNKVDVVNVNAREFTELKLNGKTIKCVFKPLNGENDEVKKENKGKISKFYPREAFVYSLSEHFGLDIVPPTVVRDFGDGKVGALQLFIPTNEYLSNKKIAEKYPDVDDEGWDNMVKSEDFAKMLALDFIIANCDRNPGNYLVKIKKEDGKVINDVSDDPNKPSLIAIDHGMCMDTELYTAVCGPKDGPIKMVTENADNVKISENILALLKKGYENRRDFNAELIDEEISREEIEYMWMRVAALCTSGIYLSKYNARNHTDLLRSVLSKHPQLFISSV